MPQAKAPKKKEGMEKSTHTNAHTRTPTRRTDVQRTANGERRTANEKSALNEENGYRGGATRGYGYGTLQPIGVAFLCSQKQLGVSARATLPRYPVGVAGVQYRA